MIFFECLFETYSTLVYRTAYSYVNNHDDAKDIVQETFLKVYLHIGNYRGLEPKNITALLIIYTRNTALDFLRKQKVRGKNIPLQYTNEEETKEYLIPDPGETPEEMLLRKSAAEELASYIDRLPEAQRDAIVLKYRYDLKEREIAEILKISEAAVSSRLNRAKVKLGKMLGGEKE